MAKHWTEAEDQKLITMFKSGSDLQSMSQDIGRPPGAILSRLVKTKHLFVTPFNGAWHRADPVPFITKKELTALKESLGDDADNAPSPQAKRIKP